LLNFAVAMLWQVRKKGRILLIVEYSSNAVVLSRAKNKLTCMPLRRPLVQRCMVTDINLYNCIPNTLNINHIKLSLLQTN
jgi:hypothetical protein